GLVVDESNVPVPGGRIVSYPRSTASAVQFDSPELVSTTSDPAGRFTIPLAGPGVVFHVVATHAGYSPVLVQRVLDEDDIRIVLPKCTSLSGRVLAAEGQPIVKG